MIIEYLLPLVIDSLQLIIIKPKVGGRRANHNVQRQVDLLRCGRAVLRLGLQGVRVRARLGSIEH